MTKILHLSDLHFGCEHRHMVEPLAEALRATEADLLVVSGDLSHRARGPQFWEAQRFLAGLRLPVLLVPGNHDMPLHNLIARAFFPFRSYRRHAAKVLTPGLRLQGVRLLGLNTADPSRWRRGLLREAEVAALIATLSRRPETGPVILVCHHPLRVPPGYQPGETRGPVEAALERLADLGVRIVLSGHLHHWSIGTGITADQPQRIFHLQVGTALCAREGESEHGFALLEIEGDRLAVTRHLWQERSAAFRPDPALAYHFGPEGWLAEASPSSRAPLQRP